VFSFFGDVVAGIGDAVVDGYNGAVGGLNAVAAGIKRTGRFAGQWIWACDDEYAAQAWEEYKKDATETAGAIVSGTVDELNEAVNDFVSGDVRGMSKTLSSILAGTSILRGLRQAGRGATSSRSPGGSATHSPGGATGGSGAVKRPNPLSGTFYSEKVVRQMQPSPRTGKPDYHGFPKAVDDFAGDGSRSTIRGVDGIERTKIELPGSVNGRDGVFEWIIEPDGKVNHRLFVERREE
jgi:hypothetical protein